VPTIPALGTRHQVDDGQGGLSLQPYEEGRDALAQFLRKRVGATFTEDAIVAACEMSGGVFAQLQRLAEAAALEALSRGAVRVGPEDVGAAVIDLRADLDRTLSSIEDPWGVLDRVDRSHDLDSNRWLLHNLHVLEYQNGER
jgi:hypothetical protein